MCIETRLRKYVQTSTFVASPPKNSEAFLRLNGLPLHSPLIGNTTTRYPSAMSYNRPHSPGGRRTGQPGRTSAGSFFPPSYLDHAPSSRLRPEYAFLPRTSGERVDAPRALAVRPYSPPRRGRDDDHVVRPRRISMDPGEPTSRRPLSIMPPRSPNKGPRPIITKDPDRPSSPVHKSSKSSSGGVQEVASYLIPASSASGRNHHRHSSLTTGDRLRTLERDPRESTYPGGSSRTSALRPAREDERDYNYEYTGPKKEFLRDGHPRPRERRDSYNTGRERPVSMVVPDRLETEYRRARDPGPPPSTRGFEGLGRAESLRQSRRAMDDDLSRREQPVRGYARTDPRDDRGYHEPRRPLRKSTEDDYVPYPDENTRHNRPRKPTIDDERVEPRPRPRKTNLDNENTDLRTDPKPRDYDDQYTRGADERRRRHHDDRESNRDHDRRRDRDFEDKGDRERRTRDEARDKRERGDDEGSKGGFLVGGAAAATAAVGAAGLAVEGARRHRHKESDEKDAVSRSVKDGRAVYLEPPFDRDSESTSISGDTRLSGGPEDEDKEERRLRRRRERQREEREYHEARDHDRRQKEDLPEPAPPESDHDAQPIARDLPPPVVIPPGGPEDPPLREQKSYERRPEPGSSPRERRHRRYRRHRRHHSRTRDEDSYSSPSSPSSEGTDDDNIDGHLTREPPRVVTPSNEIANAKLSLPPAPPKGILKKAKDKFPEPPNPVREGVAPLDAAKKGIPPEARWTRINRRLVNPEALEQEGVRFEEYPDYVIVLKVLNQEEISRYAQKTHEIREKRRIQTGAPPGTEGEVSDRS